MSFQAKITRARFVVGPFSSEQMQTIAQVTADSVASRIRRGMNVDDAPAKPLKPGRNGLLLHAEKVAAGLVSLPTRPAATGAG